MAADTRRLTRALLSVSDKSGLVDFARLLVGLEIELLSTGGSAGTLSDAGLPVTEVSDHTGFPEIMDGRVKTLHPKIHGGILGRRALEADQAAMAAHRIAPIDLVVSNLYPFRQTVESGAGREACIEQIDIGGPALIRAAAKNHADVTVITDPADYGPVAEELEATGGATSLALRRRLAAAAYAHTAAYDTAVAHWMGLELGEVFPERISFAGRRVQDLRYGENPHQKAAFYRVDGGPVAPGPGLASARQLQGKALSYNNLNDTDAAFELAAEFDRPAVAIIKHANPCGVAVADGLAQAHARALACDPVSAFGGIVAVNRPLDPATAQAIAELFTEVVIAPAVGPAALEVFARKPNLRVLATGALPDPAAAGMTVKSVAGGFLLQGRDDGRIAPADLKVVSLRAPSQAELADLVFAFRVAKHVKSNAIVYAKDGATVGIGAGQMSRVDSSRIAAWKAREGRRRGGAALPRLGGRLRRLLPLRRRPSGRRRGRRHRGDQAGRLGPGRGNHRRRRQGRSGHGLHRPPPLPPLTGGSAARPWVQGSRPAKWRARRSTKPRTLGDRWRPGG
jgi:phosphoribosylaminoimidazolecarboxamide formyltransferase/IMP cyclohydrolase